MERFAGVVIVAAGQGTRFGDRGKVLAEAGGRSLLVWSLEAAWSAVSTAEIVVVCGEHTRASIDELIAAVETHVPMRTCLGGDERQASVRAGLDALSGSTEVIVIHDAARPLATAAMFDDVAHLALEQGAAIITAPVTDTIKQVAGERVVQTIPRDHLRAAQTPQAFRRDVLAEAMSQAASSDVSFTDEAALLEWAETPVLVRDGGVANLKVTVPDDLLLIDVLLRARLEGAGDVST